MGLFGGIGHALGGLFGGGGNPPPVPQGTPFDQAFAPQPAQQTRPGVDWHERLASLGALLRDDPGVFDAYQNRRAQMQEHEAQMQAAQQRAEAENQQWYQHEDYKNTHQPPPQPYRTEDNAGNVWEIGADGVPKRIFTDQIPKMYVQGDQAVQIPNPWASPQGGVQEGRTATNPQTGEKLMFRGGQWVPAGGGGGNAPGGFPR